MDAAELPDGLAKKLPRYAQLPVTPLDRLAVGQSLKGRGAVEFLLMDALRRSLEAAGTIAAMAVVVDAEDEAAEAFNRHFHFLPSSSSPAACFCR